MFGFIFALLAGFFVSLQSAVNSSLNQKIGVWPATALVHFIGLVFAVVLMFIFSKNIDFKAALTLNKVYLTGGLLGVLIISSVVMSYGLLGASLTTILMLFSQLITSAIIDTKGLLGMNKIPFTTQKLFGIIIIFIGIIIFNINK